ncbi:3'-5' exonuclease [Salegentibacter sp. HM20]
MVDKLKLENILFLDIESVPQFGEHAMLDEETKTLWEQKTQYQRRDEISAEDFYERAGIWAEFGKIVCLSAGYFHFKGEARSFRITSFQGPEKELLEKFSKLLAEHFSAARHLLCAHNGKEFDFPFIARRMIIHGIKLPEKLNLFGRRPWEVPHLDTMELWKFGDHKHFTSLKLLTHVLGIPSPKDDISGADVCRVYYKDNDLPRIVEYCEKDVIAIAQVLLRLRQEALLTPEEIISV